LPAAALLATETFDSLQQRGLPSINLFPIAQSTAARFRNNEQGSLSFAWDLLVSRAVDKAYAHSSATADASTAFSLHADAQMSRAVTPAPPDIASTGSGSLRRFCPYSWHDYSPNRRSPLPPSEHRPPHHVRSAQSETSHRLSMPLGIGHQWDSSLPPTLQDASQAFVNEQAARQHFNAHSALFHAPSSHTSFNPPPPPPSPPVPPSGNQCRCACVRVSSGIGCGYRLGQRVECGSARVCVNGGSRAG